MLIAVAVMLAWSAAMWLVWFSWDRNQEELDGITYSVARHDVRTWQIVGSVVTIALAAAIAYLWVRHGSRRYQVGPRAVAIPLLAAGAPLGFVVAWSWDAGQDPTSDGLFLVASVMMMFGGTVLALGVLGVTEFVALWLERGHPRRPTE